MLGRLLPQRVRRCMKIMSAIYNRHPNKILALFSLLIIIIFIFLLSYRLIYIENNLQQLPSAVPFPPETGKDVVQIPKIIHQTWKTNLIPRQFQFWMASWQEHHPEFEYWFWTDADAKLLIQRKFPDFVHLFDNYAWNIQRVDVIRYFILYEYGGLYSDMDLENFRPMHRILTESCYISQEPLEHAYFYWGRDFLGCNAVMACRPKHPFFATVLEGLKSYKGFSIFPLLKVARPVMESTGPIMITNVLETYNLTPFSRQKQNMVTLWPSEYFFPDVDPQTLPYVRSRCEGGMSNLALKYQEICTYHEQTGYQNEPRPKPFGKHYWVHMYYRVKMKGKVSIKKVNRRVRLAKDILDRELSLWRRINV